MTNKKTITEQLQAEKEKNRVLRKEIQTKEADIFRLNNDIKQLTQKNELLEKTLQLSQNNQKTENRKKVSDIIWTIIYLLIVNTILGVIVIFSAVDEVYYAFGISIVLILITTFLKKYVIKAWKQMNLLKDLGLNLLPLLFAGIALYIDYLNNSGESSFEDFVKYVQNNFQFFLMLLLIVLSGVFLCGIIFGLSKLIGSIIDNRLQAQNNPQ